MLPSRKKQSLLSIAHANGVAYDRLYYLTKRNGLTIEEAITKIKGENKGTDITVRRLALPNQTWDYLTEIAETNGIPEDLVVQQLIANVIKLHREKNYASYRSEADALGS